MELERTETEFFEQNPCRIVYDTDSQPGHKFAKVVLDSRPPEVIHVLAGEIIYQLRSALDQTAVAFARLSKGPTKPKKVQFPTGDSWRDFKTNCGTFNKHGTMVGFLRYFDGDLRKAILRTKPYEGANEVLRAVFRMANIDKHMELIAINTIGGISGISSFTIKNAFVGIMLSGPGNLSEGVVFSDLMPDGEIIPNHPDARINVSGQLTLSDVGESLSGEPLVPLLTKMIQEVGNAHDSFESVLISRGNMAPQTIFLDRIGI